MLWTYRTYPLMQIDHSKILYIHSNKTICVNALCHLPE
uniref:Uncharacterized protein n=1 Tax=Anguilla anguilla TaxID=7936 RepID=A0A0E9QXM2_ANGAN